jgi:hypothetical protein
MLGIFAVDGVHIRNVQRNLGFEENEYCAFG